MMQFSFLWKILFQMQRQMRGYFPHIFALKHGPGDTCFAVKTKCADCENEWNGHG